ncbi:MAG: hypothetical protein EAZ77_18480 [Nostocales cyanobacterium]|nr:MAG: hypothetical protein EAZ77_18480 [Nostocales cyanobacterium]
MSDQNIKSDLVQEISTEEQELLSGGNWGRWGGGRPGWGRWGGGRPGWGHPWRRHHHHGHGGWW